MLWTKAFWKGMGERAFKSFIQGFLYGTGLSMLTAGVSDGTGVMLLDVPWLLGLNSGAVLAIFSFCTSVLQPDFVAGKQEDTGLFDMQQVDEMTTVTKYKPAPIAAKPVAEPLPNQQE